MEENTISKKILMVYPNIPTTYWSFEHAMSFIDKQSVMPPLGLITVAAMLPENYKISLIDLNLEDIDVDLIIDADMVFISAMIVQRESFNDVIKLCNKLHTPVVAGGPYPTNSYSEIEGVDHFVLNEAEVTLPLFLKDLQDGTAKHMYHDETKPQMNKTPIPRFDLLKVDAYANMALQNSRGCPFNCEFCDIIEMFGRKPRYKQPDQFILEMQKVYETGFRGSLFVVDDNFIGNKKKVKELLKKIVVWQKKHNFPFFLFTEASINLAQDEELLNLMVDAGFDSVFIGLETPDEDILNNTNKQQNTRVSAQESVKIIQSKGIEVQAGFILGFDNEKQDIFERMVQFIQTSGIPMAMLGLMLALPSTQLYKRLEKEGRLLGNTTGNNTHELNLNFIPTMPKETLIQGYKSVIKEIYTPKNYFTRAFTMIKRFPKKRFLFESNPTTWRDIKALLLSVKKQGLSRYSISYFTFLFKTLLTNRFEFPLAVTLAVKGHHFFTITNDILKTATFTQKFKCKIESMQQTFNKLLAAGDTKVLSKVERMSKQIIKKIDTNYSKLNSRLQQQLIKEKNDLIIEINILISNCKQTIAEYKLSPVVA